MSYGYPRDPRSVELYRKLAQLDWDHGDRFCFKSGGDGDNGEHLMDLLDIHFGTLADAARPLEFNKPITLREVTNCARCNGTHKVVLAQPLARPMVPEDANGRRWSHWFECSNTHEPVMVQSDAVPPLERNAESRAIEVCLSRETK